MKKIKIQGPSLDIWKDKYQLFDNEGKVVDKTIDDSFSRIAKSLASQEKNKKLREKYENKFEYA